MGGLQLRFAHQVSLYMESLSLTVEVEVNALMTRVFTALQLLDLLVCACAHDRRRGRIAAQASLAPVRGYLRSDMGK